MKTYLYILIAMSCYLSGLFTEIEMPVKVIGNSKTEDLKALRNLLSSDYQNLVDFSDAMKEYGIPEESFERLFWEGAHKAHEFHKSCKHHQSSVNHLIENELLTHVDLGHALEKPQKTVTTTVIAFDALNQFSGEWHGKWDTMNVNHLWLPVQNCKSHGDDGFSIIGFQSCFTGDGFGWNYVVKEKSKIVILGFVYHFDDTGSITARNPHYAFVNPKQQLTWVSERNIYYEFVCDNPKCRKDKHYVITGGQYEKHLLKTNLTTGFQAVYVSENEESPAFRHLYLNGVDKAKKAFSRKLETFVRDYWKADFSK